MALLRSGQARVVPRPFRGPGSLRDAPRGPDRHVRRGGTRLPARRAGGGSNRSRSSARRQVARRSCALARQLMAPDIAVEGGGGGVEGEGLGSRQRDHPLVIVVRGCVVERQRPVGRRAIDDAHAFDVPRTVEDPLDPRRDEEGARVNHVDGERREHRPGQPVVAPGALLREKGEVSDRDLTVRQPGGPVVEDGSELARARHRRADAQRLRLDRRLLDAARGARARRGWERGQGAASGDDQGGDEEQRGESGAHVGGPR